MGSVERHFKAHKYTYAGLGTLAVLGGTVWSIVAATSGSAANPITNITNNYAVAAPKSGASLPNNSCPELPAASNAIPLVVNLYTRQFLVGACWNTATVDGVTPGVVQYLIRYVNTSKSVQRNVVFRVNLAPKLRLVPGSTYLANATHPEGVPIESDDIDQGGLDTGSYGSNANAFLVIQVRTPALTDLACGNNQFRTVGGVHPASMNEFYNTADINVHKSC